MEEASGEEENRAKIVCSSTGISLVKQSNVDPILSSIRTSHNRCKRKMKTQYLSREGSQEDGPSPARIYEERLAMDSHPVGMVPPKRRRVSSEWKGATLDLGEQELSPPSKMRYEMIKSSESPGSTSGTDSEKLVNYKDMNWREKHSAVRG